MKARLPKKILAFALCLALGVSSTLVAIADEEAPEGLVIGEPIADVSGSDASIMEASGSQNAMDVSGNDVSGGDVTTLFGEELSYFLANMGEGKELADILISLSEEQFNSLEGVLTEADWVHYASVVEAFYPSVSDGDQQNITDYNTMEVADIWAYLSSITDDNEYFSIINSLTDEKRDELYSYIDQLSSGETYYEENSAVNFAGAAPIFSSAASAAVPRNYLRSRAAYASSGFNTTDAKSADGVEMSKALVDYDSNTGKGTLELSAFVTGSVYTQVSSKPVDIVLVLDQSGSMAKSFGTSAYIAKKYDNSTAYYNRNSLYVQVNGKYYNAVINQQESQSLTRYTVKGNNPNYADLVNGTYYVMVDGEYRQLNVTTRTEGWLWTTTYYTISYTDNNGVVRTIVDDKTNGRMSQNVYRNTVSYMYTYGYPENESYFGTSAGASGTPSTTLYQLGTTDMRRLTALQNSVSEFVDSVIRDSVKTDGTTVDHRIAIAGFACNNYGGTNYQNSEVLTLTGMSISTGKKMGSDNSSQYFPLGYVKNGVLYGSNDYTTSVKRNALQSVLNNEGKTSINNAVNALTAYGGTRTDDGLSMAKDIFDNQNSDYKAAYANGERKKVVIVFTDGEPGYQGFEETYANYAIADAKELKDSGTVIYTIGIFDDANGKINSNKEPESFAYNGNNKNNRFMHLVSSNYPSATGIDRKHSTGSINPDLTWLDSNDHSKGYNSYYLSANSAEGLNEVFQAISKEVGGASADLDSTTVLQDVVSDNFKGITADNVKIYAETCNGVSEEGGNTEYSFDRDSRVDITGQVNIEIENGKIVHVSGFDYKENYVGLKNGVAGGMRLVMEVEVEYDQSASFGGNNIPTNGPTSGVYDKDGDTCYGNFEEPSANYRIDYEAAAADQTIFVTNTADLTKAISYVNGYQPNGINNAFVDIVYTLKDKKGNIIGTFTIQKGKAAEQGVWNWVNNSNPGVEECTEYILECKITPEIPKETSMGAPASEKSITDLSAGVHVLYPTVVCNDEMVFLGDQINDFAGRYFGTEWFDNGSHRDIPAVNQSNKPVLSLQPELVRGTALPESTEAYKPSMDSDFNVRVKIGDKDITERSQVISAKLNGSEISHDNCINNSSDDDDHDFTIHVIAGEIGITKVIADYAAKATDGDPVFTFKIEKMDGEDAGKIFYRTVRFNGNQGTREAEVLSGLAKGSYKVTELSALKYEFVNVVDGNGSCIGSVNNESIIFEIGNTIQDRVGKATFANARGDNGKVTDKDVVVNRFVYNEKTGNYEISQITVPGEGQEEIPVSRAAN